MAFSVDGRRQNAKAPAVRTLEKLGFSGVSLVSSVANALDGGAALGSLRCGDGLTQVDNDEECDDGNEVSGDGCSSTCEVGRDWHCFQCRTHARTNRHACTHTSTHTHMQTYACVHVGGARLALLPLPDRGQRLQRDGDARRLQVPGL